MRIAAGKKRAEVAADLDISERHLYRLETSTEPLERRWVLAFAAYYEVEPALIESGGVAA